MIGSSVNPGLSDIMLLLPRLNIPVIIIDIYHDYLHEQVGTHWCVAEEAVSFSPANLRKTITPVASFQVDTKREQDVIKVSTVQ